MSVTLTDIWTAKLRIAAYAAQTPVLRSDRVDAALGAQVFFKCEMFQRTASFKFRGATNAVFALSASAAAAGVITHSSGNHGAALAIAAQLRGVPAHVIMPENVARVKLAAVQNAGAHVHFCGNSLDEREQRLQALQRETQATLVHPYDEPLVIAGQGTAALELLTAVPDLDTLLVPVGGGGLASGSAIVAHALNPQLRVYGSEPENADDALQSLRSGVRQPPRSLPTAADGLRAALSDLTFGILRQHLADIVSVSESALERAMFWLWQELKVVAEPSSAVPVAALLERKLQGKRIGVILSGGNVDLEAFGLKSS